ncbi:hypothetical protein DMUE_2867, partial [Dictyocoela muelleri]
IREKNDEQSVTHIQKNTNQDNKNKNLTVEGIFGDLLTCRQDQLRENYEPEPEIEEEDENFLLAYNEHLKVIRNNYNGKLNNLKNNPTKNIKKSDYMGECNSKNSSSSMNTAEILSQVNQGLASIKNTIVEINDSIFNVENDQTMFIASSNDVLGEFMIKNDDNSEEVIE